MLTRRNLLCRIIEFVNIGPRFSNLILQTLLVLIKRVPPKGRKLLVIGTTSMRSVMESMDVVSAFNVAVHVPMLNHEDIRKVLFEDVLTLFNFPYSCIEVHLLGPFIIFLQRVVY
ncbi:hypothetical protein Mapa_003480 [Marchantia paleacea]|nr:hypothetical protein Mapa_003480 [Marchantia paleacea]